MVFDYISRGESLENLFSPKKEYVFLIGAGISMNSPSNLPSAREISHFFIELNSPKDEIPILLKSRDLRYELIIDAIADVIDPKTSFMDYFALDIDSNLLHHFLAEMIKLKHGLMTTNFDCLIEKVLSQIIPDKNKIKVIITKEDYMKNDNFPEIVKQGNYLLIKLHGSKKNYITNEDTSSSLITTITSLGQGREPLKTFAIEPYKRELISSLISNRTLIIMGYSGGDDFDISPTLKEFGNLNEIIWINHQSKVETSDPQKPFKIFQLQEFEKKQTKEKKSSDVSIDGLLTASIDLLSELAEESKIRNQNTKFYRIDVNTNELINNFLWDLLIPNVKHPVIPDKPSVKHDFMEFYKSITPPIDIIKQYFFAIHIYFALGDFENMKRCVEKAIEIADKDDNLTAKRELLIRLAWCDVKRERGELIKLLEEALRIAEKQEDYFNIGRIYMEIGFLHYQMGNFEEGLKITQKSLEIFDSKGFEDDKDQILATLGNIYGGMGNHPKEIECFEEGLKFASKGGNLGRKAAYLNNIGYTYFELGEYKKAETYIDEAMKIAQTIKDIDDTAFYMDNLADVYTRLGNLKKSLAYHKETVATAEKHAFMTNLAPWLNGLGVTSEFLGDYKKALECYERAKLLADRLQFIEHKSVYIGNIAEIYKKTGNYSKSLENYKEALRISNEIKDPVKQIAFLNNIGSIYYEKGDLVNALKFYQDANNLIEDRKIINSIATLDYNMGEIYKFCGLFDKYLDCSDKAYQEVKTIGDQISIITFYLGLGISYRLNNNLEKALEILNETLRLSDSAGMVDAKASCLLNLGKINLLQKKFSDAEKLFNEAFEIASSISNKPLQSLILLNMGDLAKIQGDFSKSISNYKNALEILTSVENIFLKISIKKNLSESYTKLNDKSNSKKLFKENQKDLKNLTKQLKGLKIDLKNENYLQNITSDSFPILIKAYLG
jgi:tetratricopeptide (TPR) repeat protein